MRRIVFWFPETSSCGCGIWLTLIARSWLLRHDPVWWLMLRGTPGFFRLRTVWLRGSHCGATCRCTVFAMARSYCRFPSVRLRLWVAGSTASPLRSSPGPSPNPSPPVASR